MDVYQVTCSNTVLTGETRVYLVLAENCGHAEAKALKKMAVDVKEHKSQHYACDVTLLGPLVR